MFESIIKILQILIHQIPSRTDTMWQKRRVCSLLKRLYLSLIEVVNTGDEIVALLDLNGYGNPLVIGTRRSNTSPLLVKQIKNIKTAQKCFKRVEGLLQIKLPNVATPIKSGLHSKEELISRIRLEVVNPQPYRLLQSKKKDVIENGIKVISEHTHFANERTLVPGNKNLETLRKATEELRAVIDEYCGWEVLL